MHKGIKDFMFQVSDFRIPDSNSMFRIQISNSTFHIPISYFSFQCISIGPLLNLYWLSIGSLLDLYWIIIGSLLHLCIGSLLDLCWIFILMDLYWISIGSQIGIWIWNQDHSWSQYLVFSTWWHVQCCVFVASVHQACRVHTRVHTCIPEFIPEFIPECHKGSALIWGTKLLR